MPTAESLLLTGGVETGCDKRVGLPREEWANGVTHAAGCLASVVGALLLLPALTEGHGWGLRLACCVYGASLIGMYAASAASHLVGSLERRRQYRAWDQGLIYVLIAGNFTPFAVYLFDGWWHLLTVLIWTCAIAGFISKVAFNHRLEGVSLWLYLVLGWLTALGLPLLVAGCQLQPMLLLVAGGLFYSLGVVLLANDHRAPYLHTVWHLLVMLGSFSHFVALWQALGLVV